MIAIRANMQLIRKNVLIFRGLFLPHLQRGGRPFDHRGKNFLTSCYFSVSFISCCFPVLTLHDALEGYPACHELQESIEQDNEHVLGVTELVITLMVRTIFNTGGAQVSLSCDENLPQVEIACHSRSRTSLQVV